MEFNNLMLSFAAASMSTLIGCVLAYFIRTKNIIVLVVYWVMIMFAFTFMNLLLTFIEGKVEYWINLIAPLILPLIMFPGMTTKENSNAIDYLIKENSNAIDYLIAGIGAACVASILGFSINRIILEMTAYNISYENAFMLLTLNCFMYLGVSFRLLKQYVRLVKG